MIGQLGKYLFLGVMLPPYMILYRMPKWFILKAVPFVYFGVSITGKVFTKLRGVADFFLPILAKAKALFTRKAQKKPKQQHSAKWILTHLHNIKTLYARLTAKIALQVKALADKATEKINHLISRFTAALSYPRESHAVFEASDYFRYLKNPPSS